ncbi:MAG TPA: heme exporter protein CcmD [Luteimonas sp.]|nr:heme exporter protein CcmD [Luteimonas sp.]
MSYREYVIAAYLVFAAMLAWDYVVPRVRIRQLIRAARLLAARRAAVQPDPAGELPR